LVDANHSYPLDVWFCHDCTTVQIDYTVPKEEMFGEYLYVSGTTQTLRQHFQTRHGTAGRAACAESRRPRRRYRQQ